MSGNSSSSMYQKTIAKLLPAGSRRRYWCHLIAGGIKVIRNEGWYTFLVRFKEWLLLNLRHPFKLRAKLPPRSVTRHYRHWDSATESAFLRKIEQGYLGDLHRFDSVKASIVMPTYNRAFCIIAAINSVIRQLHRNWELLIIDDDSDDNTESVIAPYLRDARIRYIKQAHGGIAKARNRGLAEATGDYVFYLDTDNQWRRNLLRTMIVYMETAKLGASYSAIEARNDAGGTDFFRGCAFDWWYCLESNYIDMSSFAHRREGIQNSLFFDEDLRRLIDWDFILGVTAMVDTAYAPFIGVTYYNGSRGRRVTRTEYPGDELTQVQERIREKHRSSVSKRPPESPAGAVWSDLLDSHVARHDDGNSQATTAPPHTAVSSARPSEEKVTLTDWDRQDALVSSRQSELTSIIIPTYNDVELTRTCIRSIVDNTSTQNYEIIIVDDGSDDAINAELCSLASENDRVCLVSNPENFGFSLANNIGTIYSSGECLVFLNNDTQVISGWLEPLIMPLRQNDSIGMIGPKLLYPDNTLQCGGLVFSNRSKMPYHLYRGLDRAHPAINKPRYFQALTGACVAVRAADFIKLRGFDPIYINGGEDLDLCFRIRTELGKSIFYNPKSEIYHLESKAPGRGRYIMHNRSLFVGRWRDIIQADDVQYTSEDGFEIEGYSKPGSEADGETAIYYPILMERHHTTAARNLVAPLRLGQRQKLNIGFTSIWHARGISFHTQQLAQSLEGARFATHIFARWESDRFQNSGPIHHPRVYNAGDDPSERDIVNWALERQLDLVIFMEVHPRDWKRVEALKSAGIRVMCYENLDILRLEYWDRYEIFDYFLFNAFYTRDVMLTKFPGAASLMVPWGIVPRGAAKPPVRDDNDLVRFVHVAGWGGINNRKNTDLLIKAFDGVRGSNAALHIYSQVPLATYGADCLEIVRRNHAIRVHEGTLEDVFDAYRNGDVLVFPSKREGLGLPIVEALYFGLPVVTSDGYMMKQWLIPNQHGVLCRASVLPGKIVLPELQVDQRHLTELMETLASDTGEISRMRENVERDRDIWSWNWQPDVMREELSKIIEYEGYSPPPDLQYVPDHVLEFERMRRSSEVAQ